MLEFKDEAEAGQPYELADEEIDCVGGGDAGGFKGGGGSGGGGGASGSW